MHNIHVHLHGSFRVKNLHLWQFKKTLHINFKLKRKVRFRHIAKHGLAMVVCRVLSSLKAPFTHAKSPCQNYNAPTANGRNLWQWSWVVCKLRKQPYVNKHKKWNRLTSSWSTTDFCSCYHSSPNWNIKSTLAHSSLRPILSTWSWFSITSALSQSQKRCNSQASNLGELH